jgi:carbon-monoxide dehydrogenase small subunit
MVPTAPLPAPSMAGARRPVHVTTGKVEADGGTVRLSQSFMLEHPREAVWALMSDTEAVARCMPGASLDGPPQDGKMSGRIEVKVGPVAASFAGEGTVTAHPADYRQVIEGRGVDRKGGSRVSGSVDYRLTEAAGATGGPATRVDVVIGYALTGLLAQIGKSGLARDLAQRMGETFAQTIDARLTQGVDIAASEVRLNAVSLLLAAVWARLRGIVDRLFRA